MSTTIEVSDRIRFLRAALAQRQEQVDAARSVLNAADAECARAWDAWLIADADFGTAVRDLIAASSAEDAS